MHFSCPCPVFDIFQLYKKTDNNQITFFANQIKHKLKPLYRQNQINQKRFSQKFLSVTKCRQSDLNDGRQYLSWPVISDCWMILLWLACDRLRRRKRPLSCPVPVHACYLWPPNSVTGPLQPYTGTETQLYGLVLYTFIPLQIHKMHYLKKL